MVWGEIMRRPHGARGVRFGDGGSHLQRGLLGSYVLGGVDAAPPPAHAAARQPTPRHGE